MTSGKMSRRVFTRALGVVPVVIAHAPQAEAQSRILTEMLAAVVDVIVPGDETPAASDLGIHVRLIDQARRIPNYPALLSEGLGWLEQRARTDHGLPFLQLSMDRKEALFALAFDAAPQSLPHVFARRVRDDALTAYYRDARAWGGLGFDQPIQPAGYPDHQDPPA